ncbi:hypothetical protein J3Q64DRAFT_1774815 [Phycomyces blakesleeanus]
MELHKSPKDTNAHFTNTNQDEDPSTVDNKRLRITRACDFCRRKKVKCYSSPGGQCSNCLTYGVSCEFNDG